MLIPKPYTVKYPVLRKYGYRVDHNTTVVTKSGKLRSDPGNLSPRHSLGFLQRDIPPATATSEAVTPLVCIGKPASQLAIRHGERVSRGPLSLGRMPAPESVGGYAGSTGPRSGARHLRGRLHSTVWTVQRCLHLEPVARVTHRQVLGRSAGATPSADLTEIGVRLLREPRAGLGRRRFGGKL